MPKSIVEKSDIADWSMENGKRIACKIIQNSDILSE